MAYNKPYNPDELPRFAEPEPKGGAAPKAPPKKSPQAHQQHFHQSPPPQQQHFHQSPPAHQQHFQQNQRMYQNNQQFQSNQQYHPQAQPQPHNQRHYPQNQQQQWHNNPALAQPQGGPQFYNQNVGPGPVSPPLDPYVGRQGMPPSGGPGISTGMPRLPDQAPAGRPPNVLFSSSGSSLTEAQLMALFVDLDKQKRGFITASQLSEALVNGDETKFNKVTVNMMVRMFDSNHNGEVEYKEFVGLWRFLEEWCKIFDKFDTDRSGTISGSEFKAALVSFQYRLSDTFADFIFHVYDQKNKGVITFDIFMQSCITLKRMTDIFKKYDEDRDGYITISFEDFVTEFLRQLQKITVDDESSHY